jgi:hypothetical protein
VGLFHARFMASENPGLLGSSGCKRDRILVKGWMCQRVYNCRVERYPIPPEKCNETLVQFTLYRHPGAGLQRGRGESLCRPH